MHKEIMRENDILNSDNVGSAMFNLSDIMEDIEGLKCMLEPFNEVNENEFIPELVPHIIRSLETFKNDINDVHNYLDRICLNSVDHTSSANREIAASLCDNCSKVNESENQKELDSICSSCPVSSYFEGRC